MFNSIYTKYLFLQSFYQISLRNPACFYFSTFHFRLATFQGLITYMWLVATVLGNTAISNRK